METLLHSNGLWKLFTEHSVPEVYIFRAADTALKIQDEGNGSPRYGSLDRAMQAEQCLAGVNGGYFAADAESTPLGLLRTGGRTVTPLANGAFTVAGVLYDTGTTIRLERSTRLSTPVQQMREAVQGGPFLVENGRVVSGLNDTASARRTFVATDGKGRWCIGITPSLTLRALAEMLLTESFPDGFRVQTALNLDGGTSSAFWRREPAFYHPSYKNVRNYVGLIPRASGKTRGQQRNTPPAKQKGRATKRG